MLYILCIAYFIISTIHDIEREKRLDDIKAELKKKSSSLCLLFLLSLSRMNSSYSSQSIYDEQTPWFPVFLNVCLMMFGVACILFSIFNRRKKFEEYDEDVIKLERERKKSRLAATYDAIPIWLQEVLRIGIPLVGILVIMNFVVLGTSVMSGSMEPKLKVGNSVIYNRLAYKRNVPERGDIIAFWSEEDGMLMAKRVIGLPGDTVEFHNGNVYINGNMADEREYLSEDIETNSNKVFNVPAETVLVLGDNRDDSYDSRFWDTPYVSYRNIKGKYMGQFGFSLRNKILEVTGKLEATQ